MPLSHSSDLVIVFPVITCMRSKSESVIGPIVGGFVVENPYLGWHFNFWLMFIFSAITLVAGYFLTPETVTFIFYPLISAANLEISSMRLSCCVEGLRNSAKPQKEPLHTFQSMI